MVLVVLAGTVCPLTAAQEMATEATPGDDPGNAAATDDVLARGRYLMVIAGCNDCHTERFPERGGAVPESEWLTGSSLGFRGPWGTTYGTNLRRYVQGMDVEQWMTAARESESRPPMPWWGMRAMSDEDLQAMYAFIHSLGPGGEPERPYVPPGEEPPPPVVTFPLEAP